MWKTRLGGGMKEGRESFYKGAVKYGKWRKGGGGVVGEKNLLLISRENSTEKQDLFLNS